MSVVLRVLGPLAAERDGRPLELGGPMQRAVLGVLLAARGRTVPVWRLAEEVWPDDPPASAAASLASYVSRLRRLLEPVPGGAPALLLRDAAGYRLARGVVEVDDEAFEAAVAAAAGLPPEAAAARLSDALGLWRGPAYADVSALRVAAAAAELHEQRSAAREARARALLAAGSPAEAVPDLLGLVDEEPFRECAVALLATALSRAGRQAEALAVLREARRRAADELGLDPGAELVDVERRVLVQDETVAASPPPAAAPAGVEVLPVPLGAGVPRPAEDAALAAALAASRLVLVTGPSGAGKTRLVQEHLRGRRGCWVDAAAPDADVRGLLASALEVPGELLVVDGADAVLTDVARALPVLLARAPSLRVVVTSRSPALPGAVVVDVGPLPVGSAAAPGPAEALLVLRARELAPGWEPGDDDGELVREVCRAVDGLPRAVESAALRLRDVDLPALVAALRADTALSRGQLPALTTRRQHVLAALAVFEGDFALEDAAAVAGGRPEDLLALAARSLVHVERTERGHRYRVPGAVRARALAGAPPRVVARARQRHGRWSTARSGAARRGPPARC